MSHFYTIEDDFTKPRFSKSVRQRQGKGRGKGQRAKGGQPPDAALVPVAPPEGEAAEDGLDQDAAPSEAAEEISDEDGHESQGENVREEEADPDALDLMMKEMDALPAPVLIEDSPMPGKMPDAPDGCPCA